MATTHYTDTALKIQQALTGNDSVKLPGSLCCGNILVARGLLTTSGAGVDDVIRIARLPKGAVVIPHLCQVFTEALGSTFTVKIGDSDSDNRYASELSLATAGRHALSGGTAELEPEALDGSDWITATITSAAGVSPGKKAQFWIAYIMP